MASFNPPQQLGHVMYVVLVRSGLATPPHVEVIVVARYHPTPLLVFTKRLVGEGLSNKLPKARLQIRGFCQAREVNVDNLRNVALNERRGEPGDAAQ